MSDTLNAHTAETWDEPLKHRTKDIYYPIFIIKYTDDFWSDSKRLFKFSCSADFLPCQRSPKGQPPSLDMKLLHKHVRLRCEHSIEDALPPVLVLQQEDILDNGGQTGFREGTIQAGFQERRPFPLQRPLAAHIPLNTETTVLLFMATRGSEGEA